MGPEGNILVNSPISTSQQGLTHSAVTHWDKQTNKHTNATNQQTRNKKLNRQKDLINKQTIELKNQTNTTQSWESIFFTVLPVVNWVPD